MALAFLAPYATGEQKGPYEQLTAFRPDAGVVLLRRGVIEYPDELSAAAKKLPPLPDDAVEHLVGQRLAGNPEAK